MLGIFTSFQTPECDLLAGRALILRVDDDNLSHHIRERGNVFHIPLYLILHQLPSAPSAFPPVFVDDDVSLQPRLITVRFSPVLDLINREIVTGG